MMKHISNDDTLTCLLNAELFMWHLPKTVFMPGGIIRYNNNVNFPCLILTAAISVRTYANNSLRVTCPTNIDNQKQRHMRSMIRNNDT